MDFSELNGGVWEALRNLITKDRYVLENKTCGCTVGFRFALWLAQVFPAWDVDCNYDLEFIEHGDGLRRRCRQLNEQWYERGGSVDFYAGEPLSLFPDIVVHRRGAADHLLAVVVKRHANKENLRYELDKLAAFRMDRKLHYQYALFVRFKHTSPNHWIDLVLSRWVLFGGQEYQYLCNTQPDGFLDGQYL